MILRKLRGAGYYNDETYHQRPKAHVAHGGGRPSEHTEEIHQASDHDIACEKATKDFLPQFLSLGARLVHAEALEVVAMDGTTGKDLADVAQLSAESFECETKWQEVMP